MTGKPGSESCDILIRNGYLLTMDAERTVYSCGAVAINDKTIIAVGRDAELSTRFRPRRLFDAKGAVIHPGFIDCHYHANIHLIRGIAPDDPKTTAPLPFFEWTNQLEDEDEYIQTQVVSLEMLRRGYTFFLEPGTVYEPDAAAAAVESVGVRAGLADPYLWDVSDAGNSRPSNTARIPNDAERAFKVLGRQLARNKDPDGLVRGHVAIYGEGSQSEQLMRAAKECADAAGVTFTMHHNFTVEQAERDDARFGGGSSMVHFARCGLLGPNSLFVHMNVIRDDEISAILDSRMSLVWHPGNAMYYGISSDKKPRIPELIDQGCNVVFGVDVAKVWTFGGLEHIGYLVARQDKRYIPSTRLLEMRTAHAARALGLSEMIGSIEVGKRADIVIRSNREPETLPSINPVQELLLTGHSTFASTVFVNGKLVLLGGQSTQLDQEAVLAAAREMAGRVLKRAGYIPRLSWPVIN
ncbi:amidohydrolase family protein [Mesorhizobium humile]|uniref:Amidohydrolase family protein n=1 Tax=Mesorhizobium humile TaxID=3072313 RepID=A0ABU4YN04_9HYPH|nr:MULTISPECIES: amidohydrolase family protein [unclassified Mesorhizobium]MDX8463304.1 amidohydrolase family protein [Mesorhizobium sp. VK2D]MDX8488352.1 amidohydrolase family protein [Mesorhizobium sp. VK2B]